MQKYSLKISPHGFVYLCRQTISVINTISNEVHSMSDMNNINKFEDI